MTNDVNNDDVVIPAWQMRAMADAAKAYAETVMDHRKRSYAKGVEDALRLVSGQTDNVPVMHPLRPIYNLYLDSV